MQKVLLLSLLLILSSCARSVTLLPEVQKWTIEGKEASGISFDESRGTFFIVTDEGSVAEVRKDGTLLRAKNIGIDNMEGVTSNPLLQNLYAVIEGKDRIVEIDPDTLEVLREFTINRKLEGEKLIHNGKEGFEGITFVPNTKNPEGGTFYVVNQATDLTKKKSLSAVIELELPIRTGEPTKKGVFKGKIIRAFASDTADLSDIHYDSKKKHLFVLSDTANLVLEMRLDGIVVHRFQVPGTSQEGITVVNRRLFLLEDLPNSMIMRELRIRWFSFLE